MIFNANPILSRHSQHEDARDLSRSLTNRGFFLIFFNLDSISHTLESAFNITKLSYYHKSCICQKISH